MESGRFKRIWLALGAFNFALFIYHFYRVAINIVDLPKLDDWVFFTPQLQQSFPDPEWLVHSYSEHRYVLFKILIWGLYKLGLRNWVLPQILSFAAYGALVFSIVAVCGRMFPRVGRLVTGSLVPFLLLPVLFEVHTWSLLISVHLAYLCFFWSAYFALCEKRTPRDQVCDHALAWLFALLSVAADSNGVPLVGVLTLGYFLSNFKSAKSKTVLFALALISPSVFYLAAHEHAGGHPPVVLPNHPFFWDFLAKLTSISIGVHSNRPYVTYTFLAVILAIVAKFTIRSEVTRSPAECFLATTVVALFTCLVAVTINRAGFWDIEAGDITNRYFEFSILLMPFLGLMIFRLLAHRPALARGAVGGLFLFQCFTYTRNHFLEFDVYEKAKRGREMTVNCIRESIGRGERPICKMYGEKDLSAFRIADFSDRLQWPARLGFSFAQGLGLEHSTQIETR